MRKIILASKSPRRKEILEKTGLKFDIIESDYQEDMSLDLPPSDLAKFLSKEKALAVSRNWKDAIVIGADTFVVLEEEILGKPHTAQKALEMLEKISGQSLVVLTGFTIINSSSKKIISEVSETTVKMKKLKKLEIENYIKTGEPLNKAGAFAIQGLGSVFIENIEGDFFGAVGLPIFKLAQELKEFGIKIL